MLRDVDAYSRTTTHPLRPYQRDVARAAIRSAIAGRGQTLVVLMARQMGKNEVSAQLEAYLMALHAHQQQTLVKAAPSYKPQLIQSMLRLKTTLDDSPLTAKRWRPVFGYMIALGHSLTSFLSADTKANVVGATASLLLEVDEAQDVDVEIYNRSFRPMASSTNATTVLYGTAWSDQSLLEQQRIHAREQQTPANQLLWELDWTQLAEISATYGRFVEAEIARLGADHPSIRTQYKLECLTDAGRLFNEHQQAQLHGTYPRQLAPRDNAHAYVAGLDIAGSDEEAEDAHQRGLVARRDSSVLTIGETIVQADGQLALHVVHHFWWHGKDLLAQANEALAICQRWNITRLCVDASGIGAGTAALLRDALGPRLDELVFSRPKKSELGYVMLAWTNTDRLTCYQPDDSADSTEFWQQITDCRYHLHPGEIMSWEVPQKLGHDDFVVSLALCVRAAAAAPPAPASGLSRAPGYDQDTNW